MAKKERIQKSKAFQAGGWQKLLGINNPADLWPEAQDLVAEWWNGCRAKGLPDRTFRHEAENFGEFIASTINEILRLNHKEKKVMTKIVVDYLTSFHEQLCSEGP